MTKKAKCRRLPRGSNQEPLVKKCKSEGVKEQAAQSTRCYLTLSHGRGNGNQLHSLEMMDGMVAYIAKGALVYRFLDNSARV